MSGDALAVRLLELLDANDLDAAIDAGLAHFDAQARPSLPAPDRERLVLAQRKLLDAWAARERHRARNARLARKAEELRARRQAATGAANGARTLPPAAAAALARARQRAGGGAT